MVPVLFVSGLLFFLYFGFILTAARAIKIRKNEISNNSGKPAELTFTVIIAFRNESLNLPGICRDLKKMDFDTNRLEVLFVDDHSTDDSVHCLINLLKGLPNGKLVRAEGKGKKSAIFQAVSLARGDWIVTTDSDCRLPNNWIKNIELKIIELTPVLLVQPVLTCTGTSLLSKFQYYDGLSLVALNLAFYAKKGSPLLASGANLVYNKKSFESAGAYFGNMNIASGDDMFLLAAFKQKFNSGLHLNYANDVLVKTRAEKKWNALIVQRIRWVRKMKHLVNNRANSLGLIAVSVQVLFLFILIAGFFNPIYFYYFLVLWGLKAGVDYRLIRKGARALNQKTTFLTFFILEPIYMVFVPLVTILSLFINPEWKGRKTST